MKVNFFVIYEDPQWGKEAPSLPTPGCRRVTVGATDEERWKWEIEAGDSGADASTLVMTSVTRYARDWADNETYQLHAPPGEPHREECFPAMPYLADIAYRILNENMSEDTAREVFFGVDVPP